MKILIHLFFALLCIAPAAAEGPRPPLAKPYLVAPVLLDKKIIAEVWTFPRAEKRQFSLEAKPLLQALEGILSDASFNGLKKKVTTQGVISLHDLESAGIDVQFDEGRLDLTLQIPMKYRKSQDLNLNFIEIDDEKFQRPQGHSGYLNLRTQQTYRYGDLEAEKLPLTGNLEFVENINGYVLESSTDFVEGARYPWKRQDTRLRFDDEKNMIRYSVGDLTLGSRGFQQSPAMAGVSVVREFSIQPYKTLRPLSNTEIVIKRHSLLEIYVNGFLYSQLRVNPGIFNIRDFPLATGQNSVKVRIRDDLGQEETYDFSVLFENTLLGKDIQEFSYSLGLPWTPSGADRTYDDSAAYLSVFHRWGVSDQATVGLNLQTYKSKMMAGAELSGVVSWGYLSADSGFAGDENKTQGFAQRLRYRSLDRMFGVDTPVVFALEFENRDERFQPVTVAATPLTSFAQRYDAQMNFRFKESWIFGLGGGWQSFHTLNDQNYYRGNLVVPMGRQTRFEVGYQKTTSPQTGEDEDRGMISFNWIESQGRFSASAYHDTLNRATTLNVNRNNIYRYDDVQLSASVQRAEENSAGNVSLEYLAQPFSVRMDYFSTKQGENLIHSTSAGLNTALVWVGSRMGFSQPIADSFILVRTRSLPEGQELMINPNGDKGEAQLGPFRTTVLRDKSAYYKYFVNVDTTSLPVGYLLDKEYYGLQPTYRSGLAIDLDIQRKIMIRGRLVTADKEPVSYVSGEVYNHRGELIENTFFTNQRGGFLLEGLEPGHYELVLGKTSWKKLRLEIPDQPQNILNLGDIVLEKEP